MRRLAASLTLKLVVLVGIFAALPVVLYGQFESADRQMRDLVTRAIQDRSRLIGHALAPVLEKPELPSGATLNAELAKFASDGTVLRLMLQPQAGSPFYFVASAPTIDAAAVTPELEQLAQRGILDRLSKACIVDSTEELRYRQPDGSVELLTSLIPIKSAAGCWVLTSTHTTSEFLNTSIGRRYWQTREVRLAAGIYLGLALLALLAALSIRISLRRFRTVAAEIGEGRIGDHAFSQRNTVPELASVAGDFDKLVHDLKRLSHQIRQSAEDNAHSFKTPIAAIQSSLSPVRRAVPPEDARANRALSIIDSSLARLLGLVIQAQNFDRATADLVEAPRVPVGLALVVGEVAMNFREIWANRDIRMVRRLDETARVRAGRGMLETVVQNVLENATSFTPNGGTIAVTLSQNASHVELRIEDEGPGIDPARIGRIFERYYSTRARDDEASGAKDGKGSSHAGLGLWIVRQNVEALDGTVTAANRAAGGLSLTIRLPRLRE